MEGRVPGPHGVGPDLAPEVSLDAMAAPASPSASISARPTPRSHSCRWSARRARDSARPAMGKPGRPGGGADAALLPLSAGGRALRLTFAAGPRGPGSGSSAASRARRRAKRPDGSSIPRSPGFAITPPTGRRRSCHGDRRILTREQKISPVRASALILNYLRGAWNSRFAAAGFAFDDQEITITVPASFDAGAQRLTMAAAEEAGFPERRATARGAAGCVLLLAGTARPCA